MKTLLVTLTATVAGSLNLGCSSEPDSQFYHHALQNELCLTAQEIIEEDEYGARYGSVPDECGVYYLNENMSSLLRF